MKNIDPRQKIIKSVNFEKFVIEAIEKKAKEEGTTFSKFVNEIMRMLVVNENEMYKTLARHHCIMMNYYRTMQQKE